MVAKRGPTPKKTDDVFSPSVFRKKDDVICNVCRLTPTLGYATAASRKVAYCN